jgi:hypothetical protein
MLPDIAEFAADVLVSALGLLLGLGIYALLFRPEFLVRKKKR